MNEGEMRRGEDERDELFEIEIEIKMEMEMVRRSWFDWLETLLYFTFMVSCPCPIKEGRLSALGRGGEGNGDD